MRQPCSCLHCLWPRMSGLPLAAQTAMSGPDVSVMLHHVVQLVPSKSNFVALALAGMTPKSGLVTSCARCHIPCLKLTIALW